MRNVWMFIILIFGVSLTMPASLVFAEGTPGKKSAFKEVSFESGDALKITADLYTISTEDAKLKQAPFIVLFHQAGSSRGEYRSIAPVLLEMGFNCLAVDLRSGGKDRWNNVANKTAGRAAEKKLGQSFFDAFPDMQAATTWVKEQGYTGTLFLWGSSYSSSLVFKLAAELGNALAGVLSFSPGEYIHDNSVAGWAKKVDVNTQVLITCGEAGREREAAEPIFKDVATKNKLFHPYKKGRHGSSMLLDAEENWDVVKTFLKEALVAESVVEPEDPDPAPADGADG